MRPWQHVLEPLEGYLLLARKLYESGPKYAEAWNFGPDKKDDRPVEWLVEKLCEKWGKGASYLIDKGKHPHEAHYLRLDNSKAEKRLGWRPKWRLEKAVDAIIEWTRAYRRGGDLRKLCLEQINEYAG